MFTNEDAARDFIENRVWPNGPVCPHCECTEVYKLEAREGSQSPVRPGVYKCKKCRKQFTVRIGTIFEDSKIPFSKWLMAIHLMNSSKKGISSLQISRELGITPKSAWFMTHRIREAMRHDGPRDPLGRTNGTVEADECYVGGKPRKGTGPHKRGAGTKKAPVMVLVERDGSSRCFPLEVVDSKTLKGEVAVHAAKEAIIMTDESRMYHKLRDDGMHRTVEHTAGEYSRVDPDGVVVHTNTAESFFALLKRGHYGVFHQLSKKHLHRYCDEFSFRWDHRRISDGERMTAAIKGTKGKRLMYARASA
ncbi:MAG TPA: IS1595 family transposase [Gemmataceae bacterium]|nr:IS1595 family transposase [Gemmataceae bacterium]